MVAVKPKKRQVRATTKAGRKAEVEANASWHYHEALARKILDQLAGDNGEDPMTLRAICRQAGMPTERAVRQWVVEDREGFAARYAEARDHAIDYMAQDVIALADKATPETAAVAKLQTGTRMWYVAKLAPKRYGDRLQLDADLTHRIEDMDDEALNARLLALLARHKP